MKQRSLRQEDETNQEYGNDNSIGANESYGGHFKLGSIQNSPTYSKEKFTRSALRDGFNSQLQMINKNRNMGNLETL